MQNHIVMVSLKCVCKFALHYSPLRGGVVSPPLPLNLGQSSDLRVASRTQQQSEQPCGFPLVLSAYSSQGSQPPGKRPDHPEAHHILERSPIGASLNCRPREWASCPSCQDTGVSEAWEYTTPTPKQDLPCLDLPEFLTHKIESKIKHLV